MATVRWTLGARTEFEAIVQYLDLNSPVYAASLHDRLLDAVDTLELFPRLGRVVPEYGVEAVRELIVDVYRLFYRIDENGVLVLAIFHGSRNILRLLGNDPWDIR